MERFLNFLDRLRAKPAPVKTQVAFWTALSATAIIATIWMTTVPARFERPPETAKADTRAADAGGFKDVLNALGAAKNQMGALFDSVPALPSRDAAVEPAPAAAPPAATYATTSAHTGGAVILVGTSSEGRE
jgi:hypothetical protein